MRSGKRVLRSEMVRDGQNRELLVAPDEYDPYHPQLDITPPRVMNEEGLVRFPAPEIVKLVGPVLTAVAEPMLDEGDTIVGAQARIEWTTGLTPGLWKEYLLYRVAGQNAPVLISTNAVERDWDASILIDLREHFDEDADTTIDHAYYAIAIDHEGNAVRSNTVTVTAAELAAVLVP
jgi:hypothetical protein